eukprot:760006-Hanusia_phi.AAC.6
MARCGHPRPHWNSWSPSAANLNQPLLFSCDFPLPPPPPARGAPPSRRTLRKFSRRHAHRTAPGRSLSTLKVQHAEPERGRGLLLTAVG